MVAIYARISLDRADERLGVERQLDECRDLAARLGLTVTAEYVDNDISATTGALRPGFEALLASNPEHIIAWHQDRLLRRGVDLERVIALNVPVYTVTAGTLDLTTPAGRAVARTVAAWSQYETEQAATRRKAKNNQNARDGKPYGGPRVFGFKRGNIEADPVEGPAIAWACERVLSGMSLWGIAAEWNRQGLTSSRGAEWRASSVHTVLKRERNAGILMHNGVEQPTSQIEALVSRETYEAVVAILTDKTRRPKRGPKPSERWLSGVLTCACGERMIIGTARGNDGAVPAYVCGTVRRAGKRSERHSQIMASVVEPVLRRIMFAALVLNKPEQTDSAQVIAMRAKVSELEAQRARAQELYVMGASDKDTTTAILNRVNGELEAAQAGLTNAIADRAGADLSLFQERFNAISSLHHGPTEHADTIKAFYEAWDSLPATHRRDIAAATLSVKIAQGGRGAKRVLSRVLTTDWNYVGTDYQRS